MCYVYYFKVSSLTRFKHEKIFHTNWPCPIVSKRDSLLLPSVETNQTMGKKNPVRNTKYFLFVNIVRKLIAAEVLGIKNNTVLWDQFPIRLCYVHVIRYTEH